MQPALPAEQEVYKSPVPPRRKMLSNCKHAHKRGVQNDSKLKAWIPRFTRPSDPSDDHSTVSGGARCNTRRDIRILFLL